MRRRNTQSEDGLTAEERAVVITDAMRPIRFNRKKRRIPQVIANSPEITDEDHKKSRMSDELGTLLEIHRETEDKIEDSPDITALKYSIQLKNFADHYKVPRDGHRVLVRLMRQYKKDENLVGDVMHDEKLEKELKKMKRKREDYHHLVCRNGCQFFTTDEKVCLKCHASRG
ncbi:hypothetical protein BDB01DRAFT_799167 [Pilobolus umbonatus]|nr:hypothetical protein BDB01DRAFT_799167 [Pilobolus umbonatus]